MFPRGGCLSKTRDALRLPVYLPRIWGRGTVGRPLSEPFWGLDTERNTERGRRYGDFVCGMIDNGRESQAFDTFTDLGAGTYWIWNLAYDIEGLVRDLGVEEGWAMREDGTRFQLRGATCVYYHGKRFEWKDDGGRRVFLEASSFFNRISLKEAAKTLCVCKCAGCVGHKKRPRELQHCGANWETCPTKDPIDASKMSLNRFERDTQYRRAVIEYCAKDARLAWRLMDYLRQGFADLGEKIHGAPIHIGGTPGATARRSLTFIQPYPKVIWKTHRKFLEAYCGGRFEICRRGVFFDARQYDIISAYPWALDKCPMLSPRATHRFTRRLSDDALYGAYEVGFATDEYFGLMPGWRGNTRVYSKGEKRGWIARPELEWLARNGYDFTIHRGVEVFDPAPTDGWSRLVRPIFDLKQRFKGQPLGLGAKVDVNSMYGILIQLIKKGGAWVPIEEAKNPVDFAGLLALEKGPPAYEAGQFYAPVYSSTLTSMVRVRLLELAREAGEENVVAFHTDSVLLKDGATMKTGGELGDVELQKEADELVILKSGQYALDDDVKGRGFSKRKLNPLSEDEIAVRQKVDLWADQHVRRGRTGVKTASDWRDVSLISEKVVANNIGWELKRKWERDFSAREIQKRLIAKRDWQDSEALRGIGKMG